MQTDPLTRNELIAIRDGHRRNEDIRALLLEIKRQHRVIMQVESLRASIDQAWREESHSQLTALHMLRNLLQTELDRFLD